MTPTAWLMLVSTWAVIIYFTTRFFWMVVVTPPRPEREEQARDGSLEKGA